MTNFLRNHYTVSIVVATFYNPSNGTQVFQFLHIIAETYFLLCFCFVLFIDFLINSSPNGP